MAASTVPAAKQAILDLLTPRPALNEVAVTWGHPTEQEDLRDEMIYFDGPVVRQPEWKVLAVPAPLDEEYTITLRVQIRQALDDEATTEARCWVLINEIEQAVRGNLRLGGLLRGLSFGEQSVEGVPLSDGWIVHGIVPLVCTAHI